MKAVSQILGKARFARSEVPQINKGKKQTKFQMYEKKRSSTRSLCDFYPIYEMF